MQLDPPQRRQRTLDALKRVLLRESQEQPLLLVFEDLHWIDSETQALLHSLVESLPSARLLLLVNYRPEYQHGWGSKTYYTQLRLDPLPAVSADEFLQALLGDDVGATGRSPLQALKQMLIARTEGNPFFLDLSTHFYIMSVHDQGIAFAQRALALATAGGDVVLPALANLHLCRAYHAQGDYRLAIDCLRQTAASFEGVRRRERFGHVFLPAVNSRAHLAWCYAYHGIGLLALRQGDLPRALPLLEHAVGICQEADLPTYF